MSPQKDRIHRTIPVIFFLLVAILAFSSPPDQLTERYDAARLAWDTGDFVRALEEFQSILKSPDGSRFFESIALLTGELFRVAEMTKDGRSIRISPDGKYAAYDAGTRSAPLTRIVALDDPVKIRAEIRGMTFVFSPTSNDAAFLRVAENPELVVLRKEIEAIAAQPTPDRQAQMAKQRQLTWLEAKNAAIVLFDIAAKKEKPVKAEGLLKSALAFSADGKEIYFVGAKEADPASNEIYSVSSTGTVRPLTSGPGFKTNPVVVPGGKYLIYAIAAQTPFPRPTPPEPAAKPAAGAAPTAAAAGGRGGAPGMGADGQFRTGGAGARQFAVLSLADGKATPLSGSGQAFSADGSTLVYIGQDGSDTTLNLVKLGAALTPTVLKKTSERIGSAAPAPDGSGVVFDMTTTRNGEIFYIQSDGKGEVRVSREIQPDRAPRFLNLTQVIAIKGEPRHSRAYLYDLKTLKNFQIFHNETIRTISPEYEWVADPSGTRLLIGAERGGDTISGKRGIYLVDLTRKISMDDLFARLNGNLAAEKALRAWGEKTFAPIRNAVQAAVDRVSITKIYDHEEALFAFDSKHITQPGNKKAAEYIFNQLKSFGYDPEYQEFESRGTKTANVLARLTGTENFDILYVLSGHFDSNQRSPGADDNTSVTAINLETARLLAGSPQSSTIVFAFFTGEEAGLLGSREFVRVAKEKGWRIAADINNDMIGWTNDHKLDDTIRFANSGLRDIQHAAAFLFSKMITYDARYVRSTDGASFYDAYGDIVSGLGSYPVLGNPYYHQPADLLETVNHQLLVEAAKFNIASVMMVASSPTPVKDLKIASVKNDSAEVAWAPSPEQGIASYVVEYGPESNPTAGRITINEPRARLTGFLLKKGEKLAIAVKAVNGRGIASWDWTKTAAGLGK
ncbi:MAG: M28 family peptidase [Candidatus Aminicenantes bacterium]|nr:M28 family peptidase [Candidatus Aminicenantes bacterium]